MRTLSALRPNQQHALLRLAVAVLLLAGASPRLHAQGAAGPQVFRGSVRSLESSLPIPSAEVVARDSLGHELARVYADSLGFFTFRVASRIPFSVHARRIGYQLAETDLLRLREDTVTLEFQLAEVATETDAIRVTGMAALNAQRLEEAQRRGWNVYAPEVVVQHRSRARDLTQLLRSLAPRSIQMPRNTRDCVRSMRTNECITYVVDGQVLGLEATILPEDIYFIAVLTPSESAVMYGNRAINGAIVIYTRMNGDRYDERQLPPHLRNVNRNVPENAPRTPPDRTPAARTAPPQTPPTKPPLRMR